MSLLTEYFSLSLNIYTSKKTFISFVTHTIITLSVKIVYM